jgi:hypothetical protein
MEQSAQMLVFMKHPGQMNIFEQNILRGCGVQSKMYQNIMKMN